MKKAIGLDLGTVTLGIAVSDFLGFVHGVETFRFTKGQYSKARERVHKLVDETGITEIALGLPLHMSGEMSERAESALRFKSDLEKENPELKITMIDERLTTVEAHKTLNDLGVNHKKRMESVDRLAACGILDIYIRRRNQND